MKRWLWIILVCVCAMTAAAQTKKAPTRRKRVGIKPIKERIMTENIKIDEKLAAEMKAGMERIRQVKAEYCEITGLEFVPNGAYVSATAIRSRICRISSPSSMCCGPRRNLTSAANCGCRRRKNGRATCGPAATAAAREMCPKASCGLRSVPMTRL